MSNQITGGVLGKKTLNEILNRDELIIEKGGIIQSYENLNDEQLIDETSINLNIGKLYSLDPNLTALDIKGRYVIGDEFQELIPNSDGAIIIEPFADLLGYTYEKIKTPNNVVGKLSARRTSVNNLGIEIDGFIPPGLAKDHVTFKLKNLTKRSITVYIGNTPPMKVIFQSLSSHEKYGKDRDAKVESTEIMYSGFGDRNKNIVGKVTYSFLFEAIAIQGKKHILRLTIQNETVVPLNKLIIIPTLTTDDYKFVSLPNDWKYITNSEKTCPACSNDSCRHKIFFETPIKPKEKFEFVFKIVFTEPAKSAKLKIDVKCEPDSDKIQIVDTSESLALQVQSKRSFLLQEFGDRFLDAFLIAFLIFAIDFCLHSIQEKWKIYVVVVVVAFVGYHIPRLYSWVMERFFAQK
jgi:deoxycytidine triphosphate deaminase